jgi:hypothetical protein
MKVRNSLIIAILALMAILAAPGPLWSWGRQGHRASSMLAESRLTPGAEAAIRKLLGPSGDLVDISAWADQQKRISATARWHYVSVAITEAGDAV